MDGLFWKSQGVTFIIITTKRSMQKKNKLNEINKFTEKHNATVFTQF